MDSENLRLRSRFHQVGQHGKFCERFINLEFVIANTEKINDARNCGDPEVLKKLRGAAVQIFVSSIRIFHNL